MKQKITIIVIALVALVSVVLVFTSDSSNGTAKEITTNATGASLVLEGGVYDFGEIDIFGGKVSTEFSFTNTGEEDIAIVDGTTSCACTSAEIEGVAFDMHEGMNQSVIVAPGETKAVLATYDPLFHGPKGTGKITREIILKTNSVVTPEVRARFAANVIKK